MDGAGQQASDGELAAEHAERRKKNPAQRLDKSCSMTAVEKRRQEAEQTMAGTAKKHGSHGDMQTSEQRGRRPNQDKTVRADLHELVLPEGINNLVHEIVRLTGARELFTYVLHPEASGTNYEAERSTRDAAQNRRTGRASKTLRGAQR